ncbi:MAG: peptide chain release factor 1, partial [Candidatus Micrarchaeota archaeon]|nr:peptide chain release factor 1 [Candidatus Micrarchaeota archaeon]
NDWFKEVASVAKSCFPDDIKGIILGGPGIIKEDFLKSGHLGALERKIIGIVDVGDTSESGLNELIERSGDLLKDTKLSREREVCKRFFDELRKDGKVTYGIKNVLQALESGSVEVLLVSEDLPWKCVEIICQCGYQGKKIVKDSAVCPSCGSEVSPAGEIDIIDFLEEIAKNYGTHMEIISKDTREGEQFHSLGGIGAILRWKDKA